MKPWLRHPDKLYQEIGIYCFGRGILHKAPRPGFEIGNKDLFLMKEGDFILQVTFAWEGAVAIVSAAEAGMYGSTRYAKATPPRLPALENISRKEVNPSHCALWFLHASARRARMTVCRENRESSIPGPSTL